MTLTWHIAQPCSQTVATLSRKLDCSSILATLLINRGVTEAAQAQRHLRCPLDGLHPPSGLLDLTPAMERIHAALLRHERMLIFGDYDVDGVTATALLLHFLLCCGAQVTYHIPQRSVEGYGLQRTHLASGGVGRQADLIITVDCGIASHDAVADAIAAGIDVIVTDHHQLAETLPPATAVINPRRGGNPAFGILAGVGVAFYLVVGLRAYLRQRNFWKDRSEPNLMQLCDLVALGTIADMVPVTGENRVFTRVGLEAINAHPRPGVRALLEVSGCAGRPVEAEDVAFRLAPRINAAGRMAHAAIAVELLTTTDPDRAREIALALDKHNLARQRTEKTILEERLAELDLHPDALNGRSLVLSGEGWHEGVLGIVAARLVRRYDRPVVLIATRNGMGRGSARSIPGFDLHQGMARCADLLETFGGHAMAAGLKIATDRIAAFRAAFESTVVRMTRPENFTPRLEIDCPVSFENISSGLLEELEGLKPYGTGNPEPLFMAERVTVTGSELVGRCHRRMRLQQEGGRSKRPFAAIQFNVDPRQPPPAFLAQVAFRLRSGIGRRSREPQLVIEAIIF